MFGVLVVLGAVAAALAAPPVVRSREEIEAFRRFLESTTIDNGIQNTRAMSPVSPLANAEENSGKFEGDILLDQFLIDSMVQEYAMGRNAYTWPNTLWPGNTIVWEFGVNEFNDVHKAAIIQGIADIENHTCIRFRYREPQDKVYVRLTGSGSGCFAHIGYWQSRGIHTLNLALNTPGNGCFRHATIVHEWLHIIGFLHMQATYNRDDYVRIIEKNLRPGTEHNFAIYNQDRVSNLQVGYEYSSCMHYGPYAFSANNEPTMVALQKHDGNMGQRLYVTDKDWLRTNRHYNCPGAWA